MAVKIKQFGYRVDVVSILKPELCYILLIYDYLKIILKLGCVRRWICGSEVKASSFLFRKVTAEQGKPMWFPLADVLCLRLILHSDTRENHANITFPRAWKETLIFTGRERDFCFLLFVRWLSLEVNDDWFLISRLNLFPPVGAAEAECQARSKIFHPLPSRLLFCHSSRAAAYKAYPGGVCSSKLLLCRRSLGNFLLWHACSISAKIAALRQILSSFGIGELNCWKVMQLLTSHTATGSEAYLIDVKWKMCMKKWSCCALKWLSILHSWIAGLSSGLLFFSHIRALELLFRQGLSFANTALFCIAKDIVCHRNWGEYPGENILMVVQGCMRMDSESSAAKTVSWSGFCWAAGKKMEV